MRFWVEGVGLGVLWQTGPEAKGGHALVMLGLEGASWHLELVGDADSLRENPPGEEDLLVIYRGQQLTDAEVRRLQDAGGRLVSARNPYWDENGTMIVDPDGYRLVLSHRVWSTSSPRHND